ncbi:anaphase-promoting complex component Cut20/Apc4 [Aspergillus niger]|nr:anaphase-promoting complex component Cut20/Apc4 [Aspergillus niger]
MAEDHDSRPPHEPQLTPVGEKSLPAKCKANILTYCPTMDLIALSSEDDELLVYRLNGQKVLGGSFKGDPYLDEDDGGGEIRGLKWKNTGHLLSVACADNTIRVISAYSGKTVHHYPAYQSEGESSPPVKVTCLGWGVNFTDTKAAKRHLHDAAGQVSVDDLLSPDNHPSKAAALLKADLPRELALLDVESSLPKLSILPATGSDDDVFSSRASIDAIFHAISKSASDAVDVLLVGFDDGTVHLRIFDCFEIGSLQVGGSIGYSGPCQILRHASHPLSSTHALLALAPEATSSALHLLTLDLRFITRSGRYLSLLAHKTTQLQNLLRYISQVQRQIELEWKNAQELPTRYMRSVNEDLQEKCHCDFVTAAYHLVVTGDCFEPLREFLVDIVGERGHKRWEKAVSSGYENVRRLTHECLLPALESCFSRWLRHEIDMQSAEPMSQTLEELMEKTDMVEYPQTLKYIRGALTKSKLRKFIQQLPMMGMPRPPTTSSDKWAPTGQDLSFYDTFRKLLEQSDSPEEANSVELPKMNDLTKRLGLQFERVFGQIALTQRRGILHRSPLALHPDCDKDVIDIVMCNEDTERKDQCVVYIATRSTKKKHLLCFYRVELDSENGVSSTRRISTGALDLQEGEVRQVQFVEDDTVVVLWSNNKGTFYLLSLPFQPATTMRPGTLTESMALCPVEYHDSLQEPTSPDPVTTATTAVDLMSPDSSFAGLIKHTFIGTKVKAKPIRVDVNGRRGRRAICVLYGDAMRYEVLDLDAELEDEDEEEDEEDMEELEE